MGHYWSRLSPHIKMPFSRLQGKKKNREQEKHCGYILHCAKWDTNQKKEKERGGCEWERELPPGWTTSWTQLRTWRDRKDIDFWQKCQFIILRDICDRFLLSFVCDFARSKPVAMINSSSCRSLWAEDRADQRISRDDLISKGLYLRVFFLSFFSCSIIAI